MGKVIWSKFGMRKVVPHKDGYLSVFPNYKHGNIKDGLGCRQCSPMYLGSVEHGQPGLPDAENIENFWQGSKCFPKQSDKNKKPNKYFYQTQLDVFEDTEPRR